MILDAVASVEPGQLGLHDHGSKFRYCVYSRISARARLCAQTGSLPGLSVLEQLIKRNPDVFGDLTEQDWGDFSALMRMAITSLGFRTGTLPIFQKHCNNFVQVVIYFIERFAL